MAIRVDFSKPCGRMKPMHGVNNVPQVPFNCAEMDLFESLKKAGIPYSRLHDTGGDYGGTHYVDIPNVFPDFSADPDDPKSYDFAFTDRLIGEIVKYGMEPFYRLGVSIENFQYIRAYNIIPPPDNEKWARICAGIIRHYTKGWADGYQYKITYWEIWNEPDNMPDAADNPMWKGTAEEYFRLYETASNYLKREFPELKIGGYASCGFYALSNADYSETAHSSSRVEYFVEFFHDFMKYISSPEHRSPLDFFSFHSYAGAEENAMYARYVREKLDRYGFKDTEIIFNEWNAGRNLRGTLQDAAGITAMMCALQNSPIDACMYYDAQLISSYCGIFNPVNRTLFKGYYAFYAFNKLYQLKDQVSAEWDDTGLYLAAAYADGRGAVLISNLTGEDREIELILTGADGETERMLGNADGETERMLESADGETERMPAGTDGKPEQAAVVISVLDEKHDLEEIECPERNGGAYRLAVPAYAVLLAEINAQVGNSFVVGQPKAEL